MTTRRSAHASADAQKTHSATASALQDLKGDARAVVMGPVRQELLSGIREPAQFERLRSALSAFPDAAIETSDHERAAEYFNLCRRHGIQGSNTDFLICAVAVARQWPIFTLDGEFSHFKKCLPIALWSP